jgi:hypothetical protein
LQKKLQTLETVKLHTSRETYFLFYRPDDVYRRKGIIMVPVGVAVSEMYLWSTFTSAAAAAVEYDLPLSLSKGSTFYASATEKDIVMDRTIRMLEDSETSINIRTVEGRSYTTTVPAAEASRYAMPGDYYVERGSDELSIVYGVTTQPELPSSPIIKYTPLPAVTGP